MPATPSPSSVSIECARESQTAWGVAVFRSRARQCVAALVTVSTPHRGSSLAQASAFVAPALSAIHRRFAIDATGVLQLSPAHCDLFNVQVPNHPDVLYMSIAGAARLPRYHPLFLFGRYLASEACAGWDSSASLWDCENDGMVTVESAVWGEFLGVVDDFDHLRQCVLADEHSLLVYRTVAAELAKRGL